MFINCTAHEINLIGYGVIPPSGHVIRVSEEPKELGVLKGIPMKLVSYGKINWAGLKEVNGFIYIVSSQVLEAIKAERGGIHNFAAPYDLVREEGKVVGCKSLKV